MKRIITSIAFAVAVFSALIISGISDSPTWWSDILPWVITFSISIIIAGIPYNIESIRRYTYPALVVLLAWGYEHRLIYSQFSYHANIIYHRQGASYRNLYILTQNLYDQVMFD